MSQNEAGEYLEWSVFPFLENLRRSIIVIVIIAAVAAIVYLAFREVFLVVLSVAILFASLHAYFTRTKYRLDDTGVAVRTLSVKTAKPWSHFKRYYPDDRGITLSPFAAPSRLEPFRSVRLLYGSNKDEVVAFVSKRIVGDAYVIPELDASAEEVSEDEDQALIDAVAENLVKKHFTVPAIFFLESSKPLAFLGGQLLIFLEPFVQTLFNFKQYQRFAILMEDRDNWERLVRKIEDLEADYSEKEKQAKAAEKQAKEAEKQAKKKE